MVDPVSSARVYVLILNWNGWADTIECLESVFRLDYPDFRVIVCDNDSHDGSLERIKAWARGETEVTMSKRSPLRYPASQPIARPIAFVEYDREQAERGGDPGAEDVPLILIRTGANLGFAGGNNVGLRYALARGDFGYVWLLNSDTVTEPDTLGCMVRRMKEKPNAGMCGSTLLYYDEPERVQALGGARYSKWLGVPNHIGLMQRADDVTGVDEVERRMSYVAGASMLVSKEFLQSTGLMCEDYFMYYEELDWAMRARGRYELAYARDAVVYHKEGGSIGATQLSVNNKSKLSDYHSIRNRLVVTRRHFPFAMPTVYLGLLVAVLNRLRRGQVDRAWMILRIVCGR